MAYKRRVTLMYKCRWKRCYTYVCIHVSAFATLPVKWFAVNRNPTTTVGSVEFSSLWRHVAPTRVSVSTKGRFWSAHFLIITWLHAENRLQKLMKYVSAKTRDVLLANTANKNCQMHSCMHNSSFLNFLVFIPCLWNLETGLCELI